MQSEKFGTSGDCDANRSVASVDSDEEFDYEQSAEEPDEVQKVHSYTKPENTKVRFGRLAVVLTLLLTGGLVSSFTFVFLWRSEQQAAISAVSCKVSALNLLLFSHFLF